MTDPSHESRDQLAAGLSCLAIAYPAVVATRFAWTAMVVGASSFAVLLLVWGSSQLLRRWRRCPEGEIPILFSACLMTSLVCLVVSLAGWYPESLHPLPLLLTPLLLTFPSLFLLRDVAVKPLKALSQVATLGGFALVLLVVVGVFREMLSFGTVFASPSSLPGTSGFLSSAPAGLILAGLMLGGFRWILGKVSRTRQGGSQ